MNADKLNEAAKHFAAWETINSRDPNNNYYCKWGFIKGAQWLMQQPLADRLTEEEREKIKALYNEYHAHVFHIEMEGIFGKELFNEK